MDVQILLVFVQIEDELPPFCLIVAALSDASSDTIRDVGSSVIVVLLNERIQPYITPHQNISGYAKSDLFHTDSVSSLAIIKATYIALADGQTGVQIWQVSSQNLLYTYKEHTDIVLAVGWSPDGTRVASAGLDKKVRVWQAL